MVTIRPARASDEALTRIDHATTSSMSTIAPPEALRPRFFGGPTQPKDVLVAEVDGAVAGYVTLLHPTPWPSSEHVLHVSGLGVDPALQRRGVGRALVEGAIATARERGMRRLTLRVLAHNTAARELYASCGFVVEGVMRGEFHLDGRDIDDVLMAYTFA